VFWGALFHNMKKYFLTSFAMMVYLALVSVGVVWWARRVQWLSWQIWPTPSPVIISEESQVSTPSAFSPLPTVAAPSPLPSPVMLMPMPEQKILTGGMQTFQTFNNCGPAALSMALSYWEISKSQQELGQILRPYQHPRGDNDDKSVTLAELGWQAERYGLATYHRPAGSVEIIEQFIAEDIPVITRTWLRTGEDIGHYRVVKGYDRIQSELIQDDSLQGANLRYSYADFNELWEDFNYEFLVVVPEEKVSVVETILGEKLLEPEQAWQTAWQQADLIWQRDPSNLAAGFNRVVAAYYLGRYEEAVSGYELIKDRLPPRQLWYQIEPILAYYQTGDMDTVLAISNEILREDNRAFSELYYLQSLIWQQRGDTVRAEEQLELAERYHGGDSWRVNVAGID
jgi:hypothetical protein